VNSESQNAGAQLVGVSGESSLSRFTLEAGGQRWLLAAGTQAERQTWLAHLCRFAGGQSPLLSPGGAAAPLQLYCIS